MLKKFNSLSTGDKIGVVTTIICAYLCLLPIMYLVYAFFGFIPTLVVMIVLSGIFSIGKTLLFGLFLKGGSDKDTEKDEEKKEKSK